MHTIGKTIVEYPTLVVGTAASLQHIQRAAIATYNRPSGGIDTAERMVDADSMGENGTSGNKLTPTLISGVKGLECYGSDEDEEGGNDDENEQLKKRFKHVYNQSGHKSNSPTIEQQQQQEEEDDDMETDGEMEFLKALQEFETADPEALKAFIAAQEGAEEED